MFSFILFWEPLDTFPVGRGRIEALPLPVHQDRVPSPVFVDFFCQLSKGIIGIFSFLIGTAVGFNFGDIAPVVVCIGQGEGRKVPIISGDIADLLDLICGLLSEGEDKQSLACPHPDQQDTERALSLCITQRTVPCVTPRSARRRAVSCLHCLLSEPTNCFFSGNIAMKSVVV